MNSRPHQAQVIRGSIDNFGEFQIIDPVRNFVVAVARFDMTAEEVMAYYSEP